MEKMIKYSKIGYVFANVLKVLAWVGCGLLLASMIVMAVTKDTSGLIYQGENVSVYSPVSMGDATLGAAFTSMSVAAVTLVFVGFAMLELQRILFGMKEGNSPFTDENVKSIRRISLYMLIGWILASIIAFVMEVVLHAGPTFEFEGGSLLLIFIVYALSFVFEYGVKLQTQVDETL
ncbi:MAG: DUF2975 domain-containing protein [Sphaerochaetaceae bacterium]|nr:DUF2975 domain-containing protein [Sphaerochaetaceae bacterium]